MFQNTHTPYINYSIWVGKVCIGVHFHHWDRLAQKFEPNMFCDDLGQEGSLKGGRMGHFIKVSLWYASLLTNTRFRFLYFRISNC